jgi:hypothetical protein
VITRGGRKGGGGGEVRARISIAKKAAASKLLEKLYSIRTSCIRDRCEILRAAIDLKILYTG